MKIGIGKRVFRSGALILGIFCGLQLFASAPATLATKTLEVEAPEAPEPLTPSDADPEVEMRDESQAPETDQPEPEQTSGGFQPPVKPDPRRYIALQTSAIFTVPTEEPVEEVDPGTPFNQRYTVVGASSTQGVDIISVKDRTENTTYRVRTDQPGQDGWKVVKIDWSDNIFESRFHLERSGQSGTLDFDKQQLFSSSPGAAAPPNPQAQAAPPTPPRGSPPPVPESVRRAMENANANASAPSVPRRQIRRRLITPPSGASSAN